MIEVGIVSGLDMTFKTQTGIAGVNFCEYLPKLAQRTDKFSIVRSFQSKNGGHEYVSVTANNPFSFRMNGKVNIVYDESKVLGAVRDLGVMEEIFDVGGDDGLTVDGFTLLGTVADRVSGDQAITEFESVRSTLGSVTDLGFDLDALLAVIVGN